MQNDKEQQVAPIEEVIPVAEVACLEAIPVHMEKGDANKKTKQYIDKSRRKPGRAPVLT